MYQSLRVADRGDLAWRQRRLSISASAIASAPSPMRTFGLGGAILRRGLRRLFEYGSHTILGLRSMKDKAAE
jgi:hypothetical protein